MASSFTGSLRVSFKFQTLIRNALLLASYSAEKNTSLLIELVKARIKITFKAKEGEMVVQSPLLPNHQHLSDMRWHTLLFYQEERSSLYMLLVDNTTVVTESELMPELNGVVTIGGAPPSAPLVRSGFRGCLAGFRLNDQAVDVYDDSEDKKDVVRGCSG
ncbi:unnamed protein product [Strongylus vulgaris]|uniref:Laminin G domain-containing protein n=1 Tax=Strongylus vulgaris TaxID=40348 RepID=A0A3P7J8R6_STRVU|nr:unnamed protein product [Strongylus vulgaris]